MNVARIQALNTEENHAHASNFADAAISTGHPFLAKIGAFLKKLIPKKKSEPTPETSNESTETKKEVTPVPALETKGSSPSQQDSLLETPIPSSTVMGSETPMKRHDSAMESLPVRTPVESTIPV